MGAGGMSSDSPRLWHANVTVAGQVFFNTVSFIILCKHSNIGKP